MINLTLLKYFAKNNAMVWFGVMAFIMLEFVIVILMMEKIADLVHDMGFGAPASETVGGEYALAYVAGLYPTYMCMFPMMFFIFAIHKMISRAVDTTSISTVLSSGINRKTYISTAAVFVVLALLAMFLVTFVVCGLCMLFWGTFNWGHWLLLNILFFFVNLAIAAIVFIFSSAFAATKLALGFGIGVPVVFIIFEMLSDFWKGFKYLTFYGWVNADKVVAGTFDFAWLCIILYGLAAASLVTASVLIFQKKQLNI